MLRCWRYRASARLRKHSTNKDHARGEHMNKNLKQTSLCFLGAMTLGLGGCGKTVDWLFDGPDTPAAVRASIQPPPEMPGSATPPPMPQAAPAPAIVAAPPASAPTLPAPAASNAAAEIRDQLAAWREAWSKRDVNAYLAFYAPGFKGREASAEKWQASRKRVIENASGIAINLGEPDIQPAGPDRASATFTQRYRASNKTDSGIKTLQFRRIDGRWLIEQEDFNADRR